MARYNRDDRFARSAAIYFEAHDALLWANSACT